MQPEANRNNALYEGNPLAELQAILTRKDGELHDYLFHMCERLCRRSRLRATDAEDLFHDTLLKVIRYPDWPPADDVAHWKKLLARLARNRFCDIWREVIRRRARESNYSLRQPSEICDELPDERLSPDQAIMHVCSKYDQRIQTLVRLRLQGKPFTLIAKELGIKPNYARRIWHDVCKILRRELPLLGYP